MKMVVEKTIDGIQKYEVVEADSAPQALNQCNLDRFLDENSDSASYNQEVVYVGVYEMGQTNLLENIEHIANIHRFYREKLIQNGFDPDTFQQV
ncbi:hypothetical protein D922_03979 [Enterococcus faecalis 06-MB-DW-09]|nr:hypothetical protein D922_03979 [Enterococcus faecalis 06-MB-DW-09]